MPYIVDCSGNAPVSVPYSGLIFLFYQHEAVRQLVREASVPYSGLIFYDMRAQAIVFWNNLFPFPIRGLFFYCAFGAIIDNKRDSNFHPLFGTYFFIDCGRNENTCGYEVSVPCSGLIFLLPSAWKNSSRRAKRFRPLLGAYFFILSL